MTETGKTVRFTFRLRRELKQDLKRAAQIESGRRPSAISPGALANELLSPAIAKILATDSPDRRPTPDRRGSQ